MTLLLMQNIILHIYPTLDFLAMNSEDIYHSVQERYAAVANHTEPDNLRKYEQKVATAFGYDIEELRSIPDNANLGVSCGNPLATANIALVRNSFRRCLGDYINTRKYRAR